MSSKQFLSGNEAVAAGAYAAGCHAATAYPGTPSTEILENIAKYKGVIDCQWSVNEKTAMEIAIGVSIAGARALCAMKHVGVNVAMDPLMTHTYIGAYGGMVVVSADDPGMHSSQNEQDNRALARFARAVVLEPSDSQEAFDMTREAFEISERTGSIVFIRLTTRTAHSSSAVDFGAEGLQRMERAPLEYKKDIRRNVAVPANARLMRAAMEERLSALRAEAERSAFNRAEDGADKRFGFVTCAVAYQYVKEVFPEFPVLKIGFSNPAPLGMARAFAAGVGEIVVVEELDPVLCDALCAAGVKVRRPAVELGMFELNPTRLAELRRELLPDEDTSAPASDAPLPAQPPLPTRPPVLCAGCSHRGVFHALSKLNAVVSGDIGCYTLGSAPPLGAMETTVCMGASIGVAFGMRKAGLKGRLAAVIGDSTFFHSGMTGLLDAVYNRGAFAVVALDNRITGMTGHQQNPGSGKTLLGAEAFKADIAAIARAVGVRRVAEVGAYDLDEVERVLAEALDAGELSLVVVKGDCVLAAKKGRMAAPYAVDAAACKACGACFRLGCPAITRAESAGAARPAARISAAACAGCGLCRQACKFGAISRVK